MDLKSFLDKEKCDHCGKELSVQTMSYFNTDIICPECSEEEKNHPLYEQARQQDIQEFENGNYFYEGLFAGTNYEDIPRE